jgi:hypothetical protein
MRLKLFTRLILVLALLALVLPMVVPGPNGAPVMRPSDWLDPSGWRLPNMDSLKIPRLGLPGMELPPMDMSGMERSADQAEVLVPAGEPLPDHSSEDVGQYYRWQDQQGVWHFSDQAPAHSGELAPQALPEISNRLQPLSSDDGSGTEAPMNSKIAPLPNVPGAISREALEQQLEESHRLRMGAEL